MATTEIPVVTTTEMPVVATTEMPVVTTTEMPVVATTEMPVVTTNQKSAVPNNEEGINPEQLAASPATGSAVGERQRAWRPSARRDGRAECRRRGDGVGGGSGVGEVLSGRRRRQDRVGLF